MSSSLDLPSPYAQGLEKDLETADSLASCRGETISATKNPRRVSDEGLMIAFVLAAAFEG